MTENQQAYNDMDNIVNNISSVYNGKPLGPQVEATKNKQQAQINSYQQLKDTNRSQLLL